MSLPRRFLCAFPGRRDGYQVPLALAEADRLERFLTDFYWSGATAFWGEKLLPRRRLEAARKRRQPALPTERVRALWSSVLRRGLDKLLGCPLSIQYAREGIRFAEAVRDEARRRRVDLLLYPPCSQEAFTAVYPGYQPRRVLFQFHPHPSCQEPILRGDFEKFPEMAESFYAETGHALPAALQQRDLDTWKSADLLLCASSFTRDTLLAVGADPASCRIIPYGVDDSLDSTDEEADDFFPRPGFHALFVGTGSQRKGLHHLLAAWAAAKLPEESSLTIVARHYDPGLQPALNRSRRTTLLSGGVSGAELQRLYRASSVFVMPSLIEGFGAVYLEAMRAGCPVLGTTHTCLPDIGTEAEGVFLTPIADIDALTARLETLAARLPDQPALRRAARTRAKEWSWQRFRQGLVQSLD